MSTMNLNEQYKDDLMIKLLPVLRKGSFQTLKMDEISNVMDVSRATLYKYFSNREVIFQRLIEGLSDYISTMNFQEKDKQSSTFGINFQEAFRQNVVIKLMITKPFLNDLKLMYPNLGNLLQDTLETHDKKMKNFYLSGIHEGFFNEVNPILLVLQDQMIFSFLDVQYLAKNKLSVSDVLKDFYELKRVSTIKENQLEILDNKLMLPIFEELTKKIESMIYS